MSIRIVGKVAVPAETRRSVLSGGHTAVLLLDVGQGYRFEARLAYGEDRKRAEHVAMTARKGATVEAEAEGVWVRNDHGFAAVILNHIVRCRVNSEAVFP